MGFGFLTVLPTVIPLVIDAVQVVERIIRGRSRGPEKREVAIDEVQTGLKQLAEQAQRADIPNFSDYRWIDLLLQGPDAANKIGAVIDSVVDLMNFLGKFDEEDEQ
jgi:hypothetical protein